MNASAGTTKLYFDILNLAEPQPFSVAFADGRMLQTPPLGPGESLVVADVKANEIERDGDVPVLLESAKSISSGPDDDPHSMPILLYAVMTNENVIDDSNIFSKLIQAH